MLDNDLLLDTHIVIWMATDPDRIPLDLLEAIGQVENRFVSHVSALEIQLKHRKNPALLPFSLRHLERAMKEFSCTELPISFEDIDALGKMKFLHHDPFDNLLMAQAANRGLYLATLDSDILRTFQKHKAFHVFAEHPRKALRRH